MPRFRRPHAFTLVEVLVVIGIIAVLVSMLLPALNGAMRSSRRAACASNLRQVGIAIHAYSLDYRGAIPFGPKAPPFTATNFYPVTGSVTSLLSLQSGEPVGLGLLLGSYLARTPRVLFCPDPDQDVHADAELANVGHRQAQGDYFYRHGSGGSLSTPPGNAFIKLADLGNNNDDRPIRALAMDANFLAAGDLAIFRVLQRTNHQRQTVNILYSDGHVHTAPNRDGRYTVDVGSYPHNAFAKILKVFETADAQ